MIVEMLKKKLFFLLHSNEINKNSKEFSFSTNGYLIANSIEMKSQIPAFLSFYFTSLEAMIVLKKSNQKLKSDPKSLHWSRKNWSLQRILRWATREKTIRLASLAFVACGSQLVAPSLAQNVFYEHSNILMQAQQYSMSFRS